jgi:hypothetical protein
MRVILYAKPTIKVSEVVEYLSKKIKQHCVEFAGDFLEKYPPSNIDRLSHEIARIRVLNPNKEFEYNDVTYGEIQFEKKVLERKISPHGILYDGFMLQYIYRELIPLDKRSLEQVHIIFTDRLFGTFDEVDRRYHSRVILLGYPSLISTTGIVEAPAKPREFYIQKILLGHDPLAYEEIKEQFRGRFIDHGDPRMEEVLKGYAMQAVFYQVFNEAFCDNKICRLYNSHWQEEVINSQFTEPEFCKKHRQMAKSL